MMYKLEQIFLFALALGAKAAAWDCDNRCPGYNECVQQNANSRRLAELQPGPDPSMIEDDIWNATWPIHQSTKDSTTVRSSTITTSNLRGSADATVHRKLSELDVFQLQMYWEEGACWQAEWRSREWCLRCEGSTCQEDDYLVLEECSSSSRQRFVYQQYPGSGGGKIMPFTNQGLCWTRTRVNAHQLRPCGNHAYVDRQGLDIQIIVGLNLDSPSELYPNGIYDKCMDNHHHPKSQEIIRAGNCDEARRNKTNKWKAINKSTISIDNSVTPSPTPSAPVQRTDENARTSLPQVKALGKEYCDEHLCGICEGDCDSDDQCAGDLKCFQREGGQDVPGCSGGRESTSKTDYCYDPNYANGAIAEGNGEEPELDDSGGSDYCKPGNKCGLCQGDCDDDSDCAGELVCYQRGRYESVPGCRGGHEDSSKSDYCVKP